MGLSGCVSRAMAREQEKNASEFGDFQTPENLAFKAIAEIRGLGAIPQSIIEPTCGLGSFLMAAIRTFPQASHVLGVDINKTYLDHLRKCLAVESTDANVILKHADFFSLDWTQVVRRLPEPVLVVGNPPWVTSSALGALKSSNLPEKSNFQGRRGFDAITGKSNFDISEWMLLQYLEWLRGRHGYIAVLCKTTVARKVLAHAWKQSDKLTSARIYLIDAMKYFGASVEACFFVMELGSPGAKECDVFDGLGHTRPKRRFGYRDYTMVSDIDAYERWRHLRGADPAYVWRSGIKHDCAKVLELNRDDGTFRNGYGQLVTIEDDHIYPLYKSSDVGNGGERTHRKCLVVTQRYVGEDTIRVKVRTPKTWRYLSAHESDFSKRKSSIYKDRPRFSIFGIGDYTFSPWKVAISGFYKKLRFKRIGPFHGRPAVFDDTVYFVPCWSQSEADFLAGILASKPAEQFFSSMIFWSDKRPITAELLRRLSIKNLSVELDLESEYLAFASQTNKARALVGPEQLTLGIAERRAQYQAVPNTTLNRTRPKRRAG